MGRKHQKKLVFKINKFSVRNYMTYSNFIILTTALIALLIGLAYAYLATPKFRAVGLLENTPYSSVSNVAVNPIDQTQLNQSNIVHEMDLIRTYNVLSHTVKALNLNVEIQPKTFPVFGFLWHRIVEDIRLTEFTKGTLGDWLGPNGERIIFSKFKVSNKLISQSFTFTYLGDDKFTLTLPSGAAEQGHLNTPITFVNGEAEMMVSEIHADKGQQFIITPRSAVAATEQLTKNLNLNIPSYLDKQGDARSLIAQNLVEVSYVSRNPIKAEAIVNSVLDNAVAASRARKQREAANVLKLLEVQQKLVQKTIALQNTELARIKAEKNPLGTKDEGQYLLRQLGNINDELREAGQKRVELAQTLTAVNPQLIAINEQIKTLNQTKSVLQQKINKVPFAVTDSAQLETEMMANNEVLTKLTYQIQQLRAMQKAAIGDLKIVQRAETPVVNITYPRWTTILLALGIGLVIGYVLSLALV